MRLLVALFLTFLILAPLARADETTWPKGSLGLLKLAQQDDSYADAKKLNPSYYPTSDGKSFLTVWVPAGGKPARWIVSLTGKHGLATKDLLIWSRYLQGKDIGLITLQWWMGTGDGPRSYYTPEASYREIDVLLRKLRIEPGKIMLHGFSRGSANIYAVAALDRTVGRHYFSLFVANAGGASPDYPPTAKIDKGVYGKKPFDGTNWVTSCGDKDPNPDRDGCQGMRQTAEWLKGLGANVVLAIEDPKGGHGALHLNPDNVARLLDLFLKQ